MKKLTISKLFLYRHRFVIGYLLLGLAFVALLFLLPTIAPVGLSEAEMSSAVASYNLRPSTITSGSLVDLPYHALQKLSVLAFGLTPFAIKLPSIIIGLVLGFLLVLLLNRWFKNNVALLASVITILSTPFLYLTGSGTPLIMLVLWPVLLLWLGSKIQGVKKPRPLYSIVFAFIMLASVFTPYLVYLDLFILGYALAHPHLRFTIKSLPKIPLILSTIIIVGGLAVFIFNLISHPADIEMLFFARDFNPGNLAGNFGTAMSMLFSWNGQIEGLYLAPLISLATAFLALAGLISTTKGFFASRNAIASYFIIFTLILAAFNPDAVLLIILPLSILTAHGLRYILQKWYGLFPSNPYARVAGLIPIVIFISCILLAGLTHYGLGYRYNAYVAENFSEDLSLLRAELPGDTPIFLPAAGLERDFYSILADRGLNPVYTTLTPDEDPSTPVFSEERSALALFATFGKLPENPLNYQISRIITSPKSDNSDRIYVYSLIEGE